MLKRKFSQYNCHNKLLIHIIITMSTQSLLNYRVVRWATWSLLWLRNIVALCESWITYRSQAIKTVPGGLYNYPQLHVILSDGLLLWCILDLESAFLQGCWKENYNPYSSHNHLNLIIPIPFNITGLQHKKPVFRQFCEWNTYGSYSLYQSSRDGRICSPWCTKITQLCGQARKL